MNRRRFGQLVCGGVAASFLGGPSDAMAADFGGRFVVSLQAEGGWDPTSFCDPKENTPGELIINHWAETEGTRTAGNIPYAPFANNEALFTRYHDMMLVINGVDAQTNSHDAGVTHNWSGRLAEGYPSITALYAAAVAPDLPMTYLSFGGFSNTQGVTRFTRVNDPNTILNVSSPNRQPGQDDYGFIRDSSWSIVQAAHRARQTRLVDATAVVPRARRNRRFYQSAVDNAGGLNAFASALPPSDQLQQDEDLGMGQWSSLKKQAQIALTAFKAGVSVSADLQLGGFDTHERHDELHEPLLANVADSIDYLWTEADRLGIADRLLLIVGSDFARTNFYNSQNGKDHWPIGSMVIMEQSASWTNRVVGVTDELHNAVTIDPTTLAPDADGTLLHPSHVHDALRGYLGIADEPATRQFGFGSEILPLFG